MGAFAELFEKPLVSKPSGPKIFGWSGGGEIHERADTNKVWEEERRHVMGSALVTLCESVDDGDRGGVVLLFKGTDEGGGFTPHVSKREDGVIELHFCGDIEAEAFLHALRAVVEKSKHTNAGGYGVEEITSRRLR